MPTIINADFFTDKVFNQMFAIQSSCPMFPGRFTPTRLKRAKTILNLLDRKDDTAVAKLGQMVHVAEWKTLTLDCNVKGVPIYWKKYDSALRRQKVGGVGSGRHSRFYQLS